MTENGPPAKQKGWRRGDTALLTAGAAACAICCAGPLIGLLAAVGLTSAVLAAAVPAFAVVAVGAVGGVWWLRRRSRAQCVASTVADLTMPTVRLGDHDAPDPALPLNIATPDLEPPAH